MDDLFEIFSNPYALTAALVLGIVSTYFCIAGMRQRNMPSFLLGIGVGLPSFNVFSWKLWVAGGAVSGLALYLRSQINSV